MNRFRQVCVAVATAVFASAAASADDCVSFWGTDTYTAGNAPFSLATADFNRDGYLDVVVANSLANNVTVRLGQAYREFGAATTFAAGLAPVYVLAADLN